MTDSVLHLYLATDLTPVGARCARSGGDAHGRRATCRCADAVDMVVRGEINDAKTVIGLLLVDRRLAGNRDASA